MDSIQVPCSVCDGHPVAVPSDQLRDGRHPHYTCVGCAKKVDKLGGPRAARERKSMNLDHHTLRLDGERRGHRWPAGMTARSRTVPTDQQGSDLRAKQLQERLTIQSSLMSIPVMVW